MKFERLESPVMKKAAQVAEVDQMFPPVVEVKASELN